MDNNNCSINNCKKPIEAKGLCLTHYNKKYEQEHKEIRLAQHREYTKRRLKKYPWFWHWSAARSRCNCKSDFGYEYYGGRGIQFLITLEEVGKLWFRDKAFLLRQPSIDRKDNDGNYTFKNCRFIELSKNSKRKFFNGKKGSRAYLSTTR